jgi:hypothetical protein
MQSLAIAQGAHTDLGIESTHNNGGLDHGDYTLDGFDSSLS